MEDGDRPLSKVYHERRCNNGHNVKQLTPKGYVQKLFGSCSPESSTNSKYSIDSTILLNLYQNGMLTLYVISFNLKFEISVILSTLSFTQEM